MENRNLNKIEYKTENLFEWIFDEKNSFFIPFFQREYEWGETQIKNLFWDVVNRQADKNEHSMGFVQINEKEEQNKEIRVIDGQQRITTFLIFTKVFKDLIFENFQDKLENMYDLKKIEKVDEFKFDSSFYGTKLTKFLKDEIDINTKDATFKVFNKNYNIVKKLIKEHSKNNKDLIIQCWEAFKTYFFIGILKWKIKKTQVELEIFKNLNSKNKPLSTHDLIKVYLINKLDDDLFRQKGIEDKIERPFRSNFGNISKLGEKFYGNYVNYFRYLHNVKKIENNLAENFKYHFINDNQPINREIWEWNKFKEKVNEISKFFMFEKILRGKSLNGTDFNDLKEVKKYKIDLVDFRTNSMFPLLFYLFDNYFKVDIRAIPRIKEFVLGIKEPKSFHQALKILELYRVRHHGFTNNDSLTEYFGKLITILNQYAENENFLKIIPQKMWEYFTKPELNHIPSQNTFEERLKSEQLQQWAQKIVLKNIEQFYVNYGNQQEEITYPIPEQNNPSIEHIAPQSPNEIWEENIDANGDEYKRRINLIGNLMWIPFKINNKVSNYNFDKKIIEYKKELLDKKAEIFHIVGDYKKKSFNKIKPLDQYNNEWTWNSIQKRTEELANVIANYVFKDPEFKD